MAGASTKDKLMDAALDLFSRKGFDATNVDEIAGAIGIKGPNIYKYFKGKEDLFNSLMNRCEESYHREMKQRREEMLHIHTAAELKALGMKQIEFTMRNETVRRFRMMCCIEQYRNEALRELATFHQMTFITGFYREIFSGMIENGDMTGSDPELLALEYVAPVSILLQLSDREPERIEEILAMAERHIDHFTETYFVK